MPDQSLPPRAVPAPPLHVVVIGAGIIGAASAVELLRDGHRVTIVEPGPPGGEQAASYGNGGWLCPCSVLPVSEPGLWRKVPGYLLRPLGPLAIRWTYLPKLVPWLWQFLRAGSSMDRVRTLARALRPLVEASPERHLALATEAGVADLISRTGLLYVFPDRTAFEAEAPFWAIRRENGVRWLELDAAELRQREPQLDRRYTFGVFIEDGGHCRDPGGYVAALVRHAQALGAELVEAHTYGFAIADGRLRSVTTSAGEIAADRAVIAAGARSKPLALAAGDDVPLETERGYHAMIEQPEAGPRHPLMPSDGKMVNTMMTGGLRVAGQVELGGLAARPNWRRARILRNQAVAAYPGLPRDLPGQRVKVWMGHRPSLPDSLPVIGPASGCADVFHAYGHGHLGLASGATTGRLVADLIGGRTPVIDPAPYAAGRFRR